MIFEILIIFVCFIGFLLLAKFITQPKNIIIEAHPDNTGTLHSKVKTDGKVLITKTGLWETNETTTPVFVKNFFGTTAYYITSPNEIHPKTITHLAINPNEPDPETKKKNYENKLMRQILENAKADLLNTKVILILMLGIVALIVAYFVFVAPNMVPKEVIPELLNASKNTGVIY